jgi:hypothetical protein
MIDMEAVASMSSRDAVRFSRADCRRPEKPESPRAPTPRCSFRRELQRGGGRSNEHCFSFSMRTPVSHAVELLDEPSPCDACRFAERCRDERLACDAFSMFAAGAISRDS